MLEIREFLNPRSMVTPGIAGGVAMLIANTLWLQFEVPPRWTALVVSFLCGLLALAGAGLPAWQRLVYYVLNSLIIFSVGVGTNSIGTGAVGSGGATHENKSAQVEKLQSIVFPLGVSTAYAQDSGIGRPRATVGQERQGPQEGLREDGRRERELQRERQELQRQKEELQRQKEELKGQRKVSPEQGNRPFFRPWF